MATYDRWQTHQNEDCIYVKTKIVEFEKSYSRSYFNAHYIC